MKKIHYTTACLFALPHFLLGADDAKKAKPAASPEYQSFQEWNAVDLNQKVTELPEFADVAKRKEIFEKRNEPAQIEALAKELFSLWDPQEKSSSRELITKRLDPLKAETYELYKQGKYQEALDSFRGYFLAKLRLIFEDKKGLTSRGYEGRFKGGTNNYDGKLSLATKGIYQIPSTKQTVRIGEPGMTHWEFTRSGPFLWENLDSTEFEYFNGAYFSSLWWKFTDTREQKYLDRYLAYCDDYFLNHKLQENLNIGNIDLGKFGTNNAFATLYSISEIARWLPPSGEGYSSATLARQIVGMLRVDLPQSLYYNRQQSNNHSTGAVHTQLAVANYLHDFRFAKVMEEETRRQFEAYATLFDMPDGAMPGKNMGYAYHELQENLISMGRIRDYNFAWATPQWDREMTDRLMRRAFYVLNLFNPNGETIQLYKADWRNSPFDTNYIYKISRELPRLWEVPAVAAIAQRIVHNQLIPSSENARPLMAPDRPVALEGEGVKEGAEPPYTSISFPYTRTHIMRNGWNPKTVSFGVFGENPGRGDDGGSFHNAKCTNILEIGTLGKDLLTNGVDAVYNFVPSPVVVDGLSQFAVANKGPSARKGDNNEGLLPLEQHRIHHSRSFDVVEGFYNGMWANTIDHEPLLYDWKYRDEVLKKAVTGISHRRAVQFIKEQGIWVVIDVLDAPGEHDYTQQFFMIESLKGKSADFGYSPDDFSVDQEALTLKSMSKNKPNIVLHYAGPASDHLQIAKVATKVEPEDTYKFERADRKRDKQFLHLKSAWKASGTSLLITVLEGTGPEGKNDPIAEFKREKNGFTAKLASGGTLHFQANLTKDNPDGFESKLTIAHGKGNEKGLVLGAKSYEFGGPKGTETSPIYRPIRELSITPEQQAFADFLDIGVNCPDKDVEIHYSLDGNDPTLLSPVYKQPIKVTGSVLFKARAFRKGVKEMPLDPVSGTLMGRVFSASYTRQEPLPALTVDASTVQPGLKYQYFAAKWPYLLFGAPTLKPSKQGVVKALFDISPAEGSKEAFGLFYTGYIEVPKDGVYTFYAPDEFMKYRPLSGYDLNMWVGSDASNASAQAKNWTQWYPATRRHAFGTWSTVLQKGLHPFKVYYADLRPGGHLIYGQHSYQALNIPGQTKTFFDGKTPTLEVSGPGISRQPVPVAWFKN